MISRILERLEEYKYSHFVEHDSEMIEHCKEQEKYCEGSDCFLCLWDRAISIVQEVAKEYGNGWIPCSERLPEFDQEVLITADDCTVYQCVMRNGGLCVFEDGWIDIKHVIAWRPLPTPYQKGE